MTSTGTATKNNHDSETTAMAKSSTANGSSATAPMPVATADRRARSRHDGRGLACRSSGQASTTSAVVSAVRNRSNAISSRTKPSHDSW